MNRSFNQALGAGYTNPRQKIRLMSESWLSEQGFCLHCGNPALRRFSNNRAVVGFFWPNCLNEYKLKSKGGPLGEKLPTALIIPSLQRAAGNRFFLYKLITHPPCALKTCGLCQSAFLPRTLLKSERPCPLPLNGPDG